MSPRQTSTSNVATRTAAANRERRRRFVRQLLERFVWVIPEIPDELLVAVVRVIAEELEARLPSTDIRHPAVPNSERPGAEFRHGAAGPGEGTHAVRAPGGERVA